jgi:hypothetical protein
MAKKAAEGLARGLSPTQALREAGYPPATVNRAGAGINKMIRAELKTMGRKYIEMGRDLTPEDQEALVRGRLMESRILGNDKGTLSAKMLGSDRRVAMWQSASQGRDGGLAGASGAEDRARGADSAAGAY